VKILIYKATSISPNGISLDSVNQIIISWKNVADRSTSYQIKIYNNSTNALEIDSGIVSSLNTFYIINASTLANGITHKFQIQLWNSAGDTSLSEWCLFTTSSTPVANFTNLSGTISSDSYLFTGLYTQAEDVPIKTFQFLLYNNYSELIDDSGLIYSPIVEYEFSGLNNNNTYQIELQVNSQLGLLYSTGKISFSILYDVPKTSINLQATSIDEIAGIRLDWAVRQIIGKSDSTTYIENEKLDVTNGKKVYFDEGFTIVDNFTLELLLESVTNYNFNIIPNMQVISYQTIPTDTTILWIENSVQIIELPLTVIRGSQEPIQSNVLWIEDITQPVNNTLTVIADVYPPITTNNLWIDLSDGANINLDIIKMKNNSNEEISIRYFNGKFHLYKNDELIDSVTVSSTKYYLYIQQIGENLSLHAEAII
jgi:hypothetical protein